MSGINVSPSNLWNTLKACKGGEVLMLAAGAYGAISFGGAPATATAPAVFQFPTPVILTPADPANPPTITGIALQNVVNLSLENLPITRNPTTGYGVNAGSGCKNIAIVGGKISGCGRGVLFRTVSSIVIDSVEFAGNGVSISGIDTLGVEISNNYLHDMQADCIDLAGCGNISIIENTISRFTVAAGAHPDAIQCWSDATQPAGAENNVTIRGNVILADTGAAVQAIFLSDATSYTNVVIHDNCIESDMFNGILVNNCQAPDIQNNWVVGRIGITDGGNPPQSMAPAIKTIGSTQGGTISNNVAQYLPGPLTAGGTPITATGNTPHAPVPQGDMSAASAYFAGRGVSVGSSIAPPLVAAPPVPPPVVDPLAAQVAALQAQVATLTQQLTAAQQALAAAQTQASAVAAQLAQAQQQIAADGAAQATVTAARDAALAHVQAIETALANVQAAVTAAQQA